MEKRRREYHNPHHYLLSLELHHDAGPSNLLPCTPTILVVTYTRTLRYSITYSVTAAYRGLMVSKSLSSAGPGASALRLAILHE